MSIGGRIIAASQDRRVGPKLPQIERWYRMLQQHREAYQTHIMIPFGELRGRLDCEMPAHRLLGFRTPHDRGAKMKSGKCRSVSEAPQVFRTAIAAQPCGVQLLKPCYRPSPGQ